MLPKWFRPARFDCFSTSGAYGLPLCRSALTTFTIDRRPAEVGLVFTRAMLCDSFHEVDVAFALEAHVGLLHVAAAALEAPMALLLALEVHHVDRGDLHLLLLEEQLDGGLDLGLGRVSQHLEDDLAVLLA